MRLTPASSAVWIMRMLSSWSVLPIAPNIIAPSAYSLTDIPVPPRILRFIEDRLLVPCCFFSQPNTVVGRGERPAWTGGPAGPPSRLRAGVRRIYPGRMGQEPNAELREFLRSRRAKITPEEAGLPPHPGPRR